MSEAGVTVTVETDRERAERWERAARAMGHGSVAAWLTSAADEAARFALHGYDPDAQTFEVRLAGERSQEGRSSSSGEAYRTALLPGFALDLSALWGAVRCEASKLLSLW